MKIFALLSWYAEASPWLTATIASVSKFCDHVVAVDGAYALFPEGKHRSGTEQHAIIQEAACATGMGVTIHTPQEKWAGNEVEKRTAMFRLAESIATPFEDWYLVIDADETVMFAPPDVRERLAETELDVAEVTLVNREDIEAKPETAAAARQFSYPPDTAQPLRAFFRAIPGLAPVGNHYTYKTPDGRVLWGNPSVEAQEQSADLHEVVFEHRSNFRTVHRDEARKNYYAKRDKAQVEANNCFMCGNAGAVKTADTKWRRTGEIENGRPVLTSQVAPVCEDCVVWAKEASDRQVRSLGADPDGIVRGRVEVPQLAGNGEDVRV